MSERRRAKLDRRQRRKRQADPLSFDEAWAWRMANHLALGLRAGAIVAYPVARERRDERLRRFRAVVEELERIGLVFDVRLHTKGDDDLLVLLVPCDCEVVA